MILLAFGLGMCEGVGEDSGHEIGRVDIRIGSCNCLDVIVCHDMCTLVGSNPCRKLSLLGFAHPVRDHYFRYKECTGGRRSLEATFRRKLGCGFGYSFCVTCIKTLNFDICLVKSNLLTLELLYIVDVFCEC